MTNTCDPAVYLVVPASSVCLAHCVNALNIDPAVRAEAMKVTDRWK